MENKLEKGNIRTFTTGIKQTGGKKLGNRFVNEDFMARGEGYSFIMDGATGLGGPESICGLTSAEWYVQIVAKFLEEQLQNRNKDTKQIVAEAVEYVTRQVRQYEQENNMKFKSYEEPSSSLVLYRELEREGTRRVQIFALGDSSAIIKYKSGMVKELENPNEIALKSLDNSVLKRMVELSRDRNQDVLETRNDSEIKTMLEVNRAKKNTEGGYWALGTSVEAIEHAALFEEDADKIEDVLLHTDGFNYKMLGLTPEKVIDICKTQEGLEYLQRAIREAEDVDASCNKHPRFKVHDDMAVVNNVNEIILEQQKSLKEMSR